jgi:23S rRNA (adenine2503-C2)-methyltransferase
VSDVVAIRRPRRGLPRLDRVHLRDRTRAELTAWVTDTLGGPSYRADQIFEWIHHRRVNDVHAMTNLGKADRARLAELASLDTLSVDTIARAADGTRKLRLRTSDGFSIESVLIPNEGRGFTLCVSSMIGCSLTCQFCATATLGFERNLQSWEIVDQVYRAQDVLAADASEGGTDWSPRITNLVLMGMGEPLHNFNQVKTALQILTDPKGAAIAGRRITVSTAGLVPGIHRFAKEGLAAEVGLAVSLNATTDETRTQIMPINTRWSIAELLEAVRELPQPKRRRVTFEYVLLAGINDTDDDARRLARLLRGLSAHVNAIPFNPHPKASFRRPSAERIERFVALLRGAGLDVHLRTPRGDDIAAACGQLAGS